MSRYDPLFPVYDWDDYGCRRCDKRKNCLPACRHEKGCCRDEVWRKEPCCHERHHNACCREDSSIRVSLFDSCQRCCDDRRLMPAAPPVTVTNPWNCCEKVQVILSVDECGNLVVCIKR